MAGRGPLPSPNRRRRNAPTIPTTQLPAAGRAGPAPKPPSAYRFGKAAKAWWAWAWKLPQACGWSAGDLYALARRASLEDDLAALEQVDGLPWLAALEAESQAQVQVLLGRLAALAGGRVGIMREMRELDSRFGLTAKALAELRWSIVEGEQPKAEPEPDRSSSPPRPRLVAVDAAG